MNALRLGTGALLALLILQIAWHGWWLPPASAQFWPTLALAVAPLLPGLCIALINPRRGVLIGGMISLFYFCHGVSAMYSDPPARIPASAEIALALLVIGASGWDARAYRRKST